MKFRNLFGDLRGIIAVEFALAFPLLLLLMFSEVYYVDIIFCRMRVTTLARVVADLESGETTGLLSKAEIMDDLNYSAINILRPLKTDLSSSRVSEVRSDGNGSAYVEWSVGQHCEPYIKGKKIPFDKGSVHEKNIYFIYAEVTYSPSLGQIFGLDLPDLVSDHLFMAPRNFAHIDCKDCNSSSSWWHIW